jgi:hypothetical protein
MEQITGTFLFTGKYQHTTFTQQEVTVKLEIDYKSKVFSITPSYNGDKFKFSQTSKDYKKWIAVLDCIREAIDFGNQELGVTNKVIPAPKLPKDVVSILVTLAQTFGDDHGGSTVGIIGANAIDILKNNGIAWNKE